MRTYTLAFSIVAHALLVSALIVAPILATSTLPDPPRRIAEFIEATVVPAMPPPPPRAATVGNRSTSRVNPFAAPVTPPTGIAPEREIEPFEMVSPGGVPGGVENGVPGSIAGDVPAPPPPPAKPIEPVPVGGLIKPPQKLRHVAPAYPSIAQSARVEGTVILEAVIGEDGRVRNLRVLRSIPLLDSAATDAVRQWQFTPTLLNGQAVPVVMTVTVTFTLQR